MIRPRWRSLTMPFSQISVVAHEAAKQAPRTKRAPNQTAASSATRIAPKQRRGRTKVAVTKMRKPRTRMRRGMNGPTKRMPAPASEALRPISQLERPYFSSARVK